ncbi:Glutaredoxin [Mycena chlorophos]|uniref:Glutaredoxin n=1 Tax=Mycena chlorophos TaxID=658473 RepID=A0A8H6TIZ7_MYCCL|nr:Glutaredoxin [Mycena chlorophos]
MPRSPPPPPPARALEPCWPPKAPPPAGHCQWHWQHPRTAHPLNLITVGSPSQLRALLSADLTRVSLLSFWAPWAEPCKAMEAVVIELARKYGGMLVLSIEAEEQDEIAASFGVESVPEFILLKGHALLARVSGADAKALVDAVSAHAPRSSPSPSQIASSARPASPPPRRLTPELETRLRGLLNKSRIVLFMKGTPDAPRCGFSRRMASLLKERGISFVAFDVLADEDVRQGLKILNDWPTFPQLVVGGEFVGGLDVVLQMLEDGKFDRIPEST